MISNSSFAFSMNDGPKPLRTFIKENKQKATMKIVSNWLTVIYDFDNAEELLANADAILKSLNLDPEACSVTITATVSVTVGGNAGVVNGSVTTTITGSVTTTCANAVAAGKNLVNQLKSIVGA